jgi:protein-tyrosine phosphatase
VLDILKRQRALNPSNSKEVPKEIRDLDLDLISKTVEDFRTQRPSMVQNLSQFVLCYESVLEWLVSQEDT